jgi:hypothetical protein
MAGVFYNLANPEKQQQKTTIENKQTRCKMIKSNLEETGG